jgi:hypothetical protein
VTTLSEYLKDLFLPKSKKSSLTLIHKYAAIKWATFISTLFVQNVFRERFFLLVHFCSRKIERISGPLLRPDYLFVALKYMLGVVADPVALAKYRL